MTGKGAVLGEVAQVVSELQILTAGQIREDNHGAAGVNLPDEGGEAQAASYVWTRQLDDDDIPHRELALDRHAPPRGTQVDSPAGQRVALIGAGLDADRQADGHAARPASDITGRHERGDSLGLALAERDEGNAESAWVSTRDLDEDLEAPGVFRKRHAEHERRIRLDIEVGAHPHAG